MLLVFVGGFGVCEMTKNASTLRPLEGEKLVLEYRDLVGWVATSSVAPKAIGVARMADSAVLALCEADSIHARTGFFTAVFGDEQSYWNAMMGAASVEPLVKALRAAAGCIGGMQFETEFIEWSEHSGQYQCKECEGTVNHKPDCPVLAVLTEIDAALKGVRQ